MSDVFLLVPKADKTLNTPAMVLKIFRMNYVNRHSISEAVSIASRERNDYEKCANFFAGVEGLVPPEYYLVVNDPRGDGPIAIMLQPFMGNDITDIFEIPEEELRDKLSNNDSLKGQLEGFLDVLDDNPELIDGQFDLVGDMNLTVVNLQGEEKLVMIDPHCIRRESRTNDFEEKIVARINYLRNLCSSVDTN